MRLADVITSLDSWYDPGWAAPGDRVGLVCGDPEARVRRVLFAVDPVAAVVDEAIDFGADLVVVHHPLFLTPVSSVATTAAKGAVVHRLLSNGTALFTAHTNADVAHDGVNEALAGALGLQDLTVLTPTEDMGLDKLVVFVPEAAAEAVRSAVTEAGAGRVGAYDSCTFTSAGEGRFRPLPGARPAVGVVGSVEVVAESRVEAVYPRTLRRDVVAALRAAHPYEEPAFDLIELTDPPDDRTSHRVPAARRGHGRVGTLAEPLTLRGFAEHVAAVLPETPTGVRVSGVPDRQVRTVAVGAGSGDSLLTDVRRSGVDAYVTSDLKHHRASEFVEEGGPALVEVAHWAAESTWLPVVEAKVQVLAADLGDTVETRVSDVVTDPWTFRV